MDNTSAGLGRLAGRNRNRRKPQALDGRVTLDDFFAYMLQHNYIFAPSGELWPGSSVDARIPPISNGLNKKGEPVWIPASAWLAENRPVEQLTWAAGEQTLISDRLIVIGGWVARPSARVFNLYRGPTLTLGDPSKAGPWLAHVRKVYPNDADRIVKWLAHRKQRPHEKINHALTLGGLQGIGKDTLLEPVVRAVGPWNVAEVSPQQLLGRFNGFLKSVILRVSEARDLGEVNRFSFYDHLKAMTAAPPDVLRIDEKHLREYYIPNVCGVIITTNHKTDGIFLPADDRRHFVAWSDLTKDDFEPGYWTRLWRWYDEGGDRHVAGYLASIDLTDFDPKAPPPKTKAFWDIVDAGRAGEDAELADVIDELALKDGKGNPAPGSPVAFTLTALQAKAEALTPSAKRDRDGHPAPGTFAHWLGDRRNRRMIPHRFEQCGYSPVRNDGAKDGLWKVNGARQVIYALSSLSVRVQLAAAARVRDQAGFGVLELAELAAAGGGVGGVGEVSDLPLISPTYVCADAFCVESKGESPQEDKRKITDLTDFTDPAGEGASASISENTPKSRRSAPPQGRPLSSQERVEAAEGAGCEFYVNERGVSWIYRPGVNPNDPDLKLAEAAIEADRAGVEEFLRRRLARQGG
jgi:Family of unknown function (DUF5906)